MVQFLPKTKVFWVSMNLNYMKIRKIIICENQFASLFNRSRLITENRASKNQSLARRMVRNLSPNIDDKEFTEKVLHDIPSVRKENFHLFPAVVRFLLQNPKSINADTLLKLNKFISVAASKSKELNLDQNLNGMTLDEFFRNFEGYVHQTDKANRENTAHYGTSNGHNNGYTIIPIPSFSEASEYSDYTTWCVTHRSQDFINYVGIGKGLFYFLLKDGFEKVPKKVGDNAPLDEYGLSMIAVSFYEDGNVNTITSRWNHEFEDNNVNGDHVMSVNSLCKLINANIYQICVDKRPKKEIPSSWKLIKNLSYGQFLFYDNDKKDYVVSDKNMRRTDYFDGEKALEYDGFGRDNFDALILTNGVVIGGNDVVISGYFFVGDKLYVSLDFNIYEVDTNSGRLTQSPNLKSFIVRKWIRYSNK